MSTRPDPLRPGEFIAAARHELSHMRSHWWWFALLGILLSGCGIAALILPHLTISATFAAVVVVGVLLMVGGVATIVGAFYAGKWSGFLVQLLVGLLYLACGFVVTDHPMITALTMTIFVAASFIVLGIFRTIGSLVLKPPQWGWGVLNGVVTLLAGVVIYRQLPEDAFWVIGLLVGLEMLFNGLSWVMLSMAIRDLPANAE